MFFGFLRKQMGEIITSKQSDIGSTIDKAMVDIENENKFLQGKLDKRFGRSLLDEGKLGELIDLISEIGFTSEQNANDLLGEVYEYFLGHFATAEGKKGGQFYTPSYIVKTLVEVLSPHKGRIYDPCCGSGGMFVQSEEFIKSHGGKVDDISIYGQESNPTTWRLAAMNLAIRGFSADLGKSHGDTFGNDQFPDLKFDYVLANPHFNDSDWGGEKYENDIRWKYGKPPNSNANFAWLQHILWKLKPNGKAGIVLANGSMSSNSSNEGDIRKKIIQDDKVEVMISLPGNLFLNTQVPCCLWFLNNDKSQNFKDRTNEILFIDARDLGEMQTKVVKFLTHENINLIKATIYSWREGKKYNDVKGFCKSVQIKEIEKKNFSLLPGLYVGTEDLEENQKIFDEEYKRLINSLKKIQSSGEELNKKISSLLKDFK